MHNGELKLNCPCCGKPLDEHNTMKPLGDIPVIICTGHSSLIDEEKAKELGIDAYVMKPIVMSDIARTIRMVLDDKENSVQ